MRDARFGRPGLTVSAESVGMQMAGLYGLIRISACLPILARPYLKEPSATSFVSTMANRESKRGRRYGCWRRTAPRPGRTRTVIAVRLTGFIGFLTLRGGMVTTVAHSISTSISALDMASGAAAASRYFKTKGLTSIHTAVHKTMHAKARRMRRSGKRWASATPADTVNRPPAANGRPSAQSTRCAPL